MNTKNGHRKRPDRPLEEYEVRVFRANGNERGPWFRVTDEICITTWDMPSALVPESEHGDGILNIEWIACEKSKLTKLQRKVQIIEQHDGKIALASLPED